ncbi:MAG: RecB-family nuclease [Candidatus Thorarchaeota archaeon]|nr:RecB-family nuclease [Candidatus Thorarchaeota archaeon]
MNDNTKNLFVVLHNVHSVSRLVETAQVVYGLGFQNYIVTKAEGSAAQSGVPDANRLAIKMKRNFMVLPDIRDVLELLEVDKPLMIVSPVLTKDRIDFDGLRERVASGEKVVIALCGGNSSFSRREMDLGECMSLEANVDIGPAGSAAIILHALKN